MFWANNMCVCVCVEVSHARLHEWMSLVVMVENRSGKVSKGSPVFFGALSYLYACMSLISLRRRGGGRKKITDVGFEGDEARRGEVGEGRREVKEGVAIAVRWDPLTAAYPPQRLLRWKGPWVASGSISAWKPHTHKALKAALMPRLGISYLLARLIIPPSTGARERRHRGWASKIGLHSLNWTRGQIKKEWVVG